MGIQASFMQQFWRHAEVALCGTEIDVPQIGCQLRQQLLYIGAGTVPCDDPMDGGRVTDIVKTRLVTCGRLAANLCHLTKPTKEFIRHLVL